VVLISKALFITEKPSVAAEFAKALKINGRKLDGYIESDKAVVTWCVGHLVNMSYPEQYDEKLKKWSLNTLPFLPKVYKYEVIDGVKKQGLLDIAELIFNGKKSISIISPKGILKDTDFNT